MGGANGGIYKDRGRPWTSPHGTSILVRSLRLAPGKRGTGALREDGVLRPCPAPNYDLSDTRCSGS